MRFCDFDMKNIQSGVTDKTETFVFYSYLFFLVWIPLPLGSNRYWAWSIMEAGVFFICIVLSVIYLQGNLNITTVLHRTKPIIFLFVLWLFFILLQIIPMPLGIVEYLSPARVASYHSGYPNGEWISLTENNAETLSFFLKSLSYVLLFVLSLILVNSRSRVKLLAWTLVYSALFQAMYGSLMALSGLEYSFFMEKQVYHDAATGTFVNRNHMAGYLNMGLSIGVGLLIAGLAKGKRHTTARQLYRKIVRILLSKKAQLRIYIVITTIALILTHSRMGNVAFIVALTITGLLGLYLTRHARRVMAMLVISIIIIDIFMVGTWFGLDKVAERLENTSLHTEVRDEVDVYTLDYWNDYFVVGSGGGTYRYVFPRYRGAEITHYFDHAHNDILEVASETGIIGVSLLSLIVLLSLYSAIKALSQRHDPLMIGMAFSAIMAMTAIGIHSFVDFNLQIPANAATFVVILSLAWNARYLETRVARKYSHS